MAEQVCFHFDPICPWCYQTSRWARRLEQLGVIELDWRLFSLELQNAGTEPEELAAAHARSERGLRTAVLVRDAAGAAAVGRYYEHLGRRFHEQGEALEDPSTVEAALEDAGLDPALCRRAMDDASTADQVAAEHRELCDRTRSFGVPTIQLDGGAGPAIFGPVITEVPDDHDAVALWEHVSWLTRHANFAELKRDRVAAPDLESVRRWQSQREQPDTEQQRTASCLTAGTAPFGPQRPGRFDIEVPNRVVHVEPFARRVRAVLNGGTVIDSDDVVLVHETGALPHYAFPAGDVHIGSEREEHVDGHVRVAWDAVDAWYEKDERVEVHPRDPYRRIDVLSTSRRVTVSVDGTVLANSTRALALYETSLPVRYYLPPADVHLDLLHPSATMTECPYKGTARYWHATVDGRTLHDVAWEYRAHTRREAEPVQGRLAFYPDRVDVTVTPAADAR